MNRHKAICIMALCSLLAACVPSPTDRAKPARLVLWHSYSGTIGEQFVSLVNEFNANHQGIVVEPAYGGDPQTMHDKLFTAVAGNAAPCLAQIDQFWSSELADAAAIVPLDGYLSSTPTFNRDDIWPEAWETATYSGTVWSMPFSLSEIALYYNRRLFAQSGLSPDAVPTTWEELRQTAGRLTYDSDGDGAIDHWGLSFPVRANQGTVYYWFVFLWQAGGEIFSADLTAPLFQETPGIEALGFWQGLVQTGSLSLDPPQSAFENGQIAMTLASTARLSQYVKALGDDLGVASLPCGRRCATGIGGANLAILAGCPYRDEAWTFLDWMSSATINLRWSTETGYLPLRRSVVSSDAYKAYLLAEPRAAVIARQIDSARTRPNIPAYSAVSREVGMAVEEALFTGRDPGVVLLAAARRADVALEP